VEQISSNRLLKGWFMNIGFFSAHGFERKIFDTLLQRDSFSSLSLTYFDVRLTEDTLPLARGFSVLSVFVSDRLSREVIGDLSQHGLKLLALRSAGFNHVDLEACREFGVSVVRVPAYSPYAVAEHAVCLVLSLNRKIHRAYQRVKELNFSLDGLVGFDMHGKNVGIIGTGEIGMTFARIMAGFGMKILAYDPKPDPDLEKNTDASYVSFDELITHSDIISLHCPLTPDTLHLLSQKEIECMKEGVFIINTGRGGLIDTKALIDGLKSGRIGAAGLDVYEEEEGVFFFDHSEGILKDDVLARLLTFPNVLVTAHQAFLTKEALNNIASTTLENILKFRQSEKLENLV
jgi:D-lactate dehydrogenase